MQQTRRNARDERGQKAIPDPTADLAGRIEPTELRATESGRMHVEVVSLDLDKFKIMNDSRVKDLQLLETELRRGLEREEFVLHYQPQLHLCAGRVAGFEALLRWQHPKRGMVSPSAFVPMLEETGLSIAVGEWALRRACAEYRMLRDSSGTRVPVSVNLSVRQFSDQGLVAELRRILRDEKMPAEDLELEITERAIMHDLQAAGEMLDDLDALGVRLAIDDVGYSALGYLRRFPLNAVKISRAFVQELPWSDNALTITKGGIALAHKLGLEVIAEGVETAEQIRLLRAYGCDMIQGHFYGRPMPLEAAVAFAAGHKMPARPAPVQPLERLQTSHPT